MPREKMTADKKSINPSNKQDYKERKQMKTNMNEKTNALNTEIKNDVENDNTSSIILTNPRIDKITINANLPKNDEQTHKPHIHHIIDTCRHLKEFPYPGAYRVPGKGYMVTVKFYLVDNETHKLSKDGILVQFCPFNKNAAFMRIEYNPAKISPEHYAAFEKFLFDILDINLPEAMEKAWVTRMDVCIEILNADMEDIFVRASKKRSTSMFFGNDGGIESIYLGKSSGNQIKLYDKAKEQKKSGKHLRIEATIRKKCLMSRLPELDNPFTGVEIFDLSHKLSGGASVAFDLFKDSCRYRGIKNALKRLPDTYRKKYEKIVSDSPATWWTPENFWGEKWTDALKNAGIPS